MLLHIRQLPLFVIAVLAALMARHQVGAVEAGEICDTVKQEAYKAAFEANKLLWKNPRCYKFTFRRSCFCRLKYRGPFEITVQKGVIIKPNNHTDLLLPTMQDILDHVYQKCIVECPVTCNVVYGSYGEITSVYINDSDMIADEETDYTISNFRPCRTRCRDGPP